MNSEIEKEVRFPANKKIFEVVRSISSPVQGAERTIDIVMGLYGFNSLDRLGYICRIRSIKGNWILECKRRENDVKWSEQRINIPSPKVGFHFLSLMGFKPYLPIDRIREIRKVGNLKFFLDEIPALENMTYQGKDLTGCFLEIEFKKQSDLDAFLDKNLNLIGIMDDRLEPYGYIFKEMINNDESFKKTIDAELFRLLNADNLYA